VVTLVTFEENEEAVACDQRIRLLKRELGLLESYEFKFSKTSQELRKKFLETVMPYEFFYFSIVINKDPAKLYGGGFRYKGPFYKYTCGLVFENAKPHLRDATVVIDGSGSREFKRQFQAYLKRKVGSDIIRKVKIQESSGNNLIQLADMVAGAVNRSFTKKGDRECYRRMISGKEMSVQVWPK
jgi:hypothetical protein